MRVMRKSLIKYLNGDYILIRDLRILLHNGILALSYTYSIRNMKVFFGRFSIELKETNLLIFGYMTILGNTTVSLML